MREMEMKVFLHEVFIVDFQCTISCSPFSHLHFLQYNKPSSPQRKVISYYNLRSQIKISTDYFLERNKGLPK